MLVNKPNHINCRTQFLLASLVLLWNLFFQMCGVLPLVLLVGKDTMLVSLMIIENSRVSICFATNLRCLNIFKNSKLLLSGYSTANSCHAK
jgi:hypothetical protein